VDQAIFRPPIQISVTVFSSNFHFQQFPVVC
jgi:hypothetical protein